jgi:predicted RNase H-like HicB family nuclease
MKQTYTAVYCQTDGRWVGWVEELPGVNARGKTRLSMMAELRAALQKMLSRNRRKARALAGRAAKKKTFRV